MKIIAKEKLSDAWLKSIVGSYLDDSSYDLLISDNCDCYREDGTILFKFRKSLLMKNEQEVGLLAFKNMARASRGRGAAAGPIDPDSVYWKKRDITQISKNRTSAKYSIDGKDSKMSVQNEVASNAIGYWSDTLSLGKKLPCRLTHHSRNDLLLLEDGQNVIQKISNSYQNLNPEMYEKQMKQSMLQPDMVIGDTPFSTVTVNRNFRTAVHRDAGDFGFGNLSVLEYGHYHGGYFVIPKYKIAIDMRSGDHLCVDVHELHANTKLYETDEDKIKNDLLPKIFNDNLEVGILGLEHNFTRISLVCYLRDALKKCELPIDPELLKIHHPPDTKLTVMFVNKLEDSLSRQKFFTKNYVRCSSHEKALHRIVKHSLKNIIIIDDKFNNIRTIGNSKQFIKKDGITFLNIESKNKKGIYDLETSQKDLAYYVPDKNIAEAMLLKKDVNKYFISPQIFE